MTGDDLTHASLTRVCMCCMYQVMMHCACMFCHLSCIHIMHCVCTYTHECPAFHRHPTSHHTGASSALLSESTSSDPKDWRGTKLMQLLKRASKRYGSALPLGSAEPSSADANASTAALGQAAGQLVAQAKAMQQQLQGQEGDKLLDSEFGLEALLRRTEQALTLAGHEADRSRLVPVTAALVELGADVHAIDNEGRTALHLAAGCGDKAMVAQLVELGSDVAARDSVGGACLCCPRVHIHALHSGVVHHHDTQAHRCIMRQWQTKRTSCLCLRGLGVTGGPRQTASMARRLRLCCVGSTAKQHASRWGVQHDM